MLTPAPAVPALERLASFDNEMYSTAPNAVRFRKARERLGISPAEAAALMGISLPSVWDIECYDDELTIYSANDIQKFCKALNISPRGLFGIESLAAPLNATDLVALILEHCRLHDLTIEQFEDISGWNLIKSIDDPERFLHSDYSIDGIQEICHALEIDWQRFILGL